MPDAKLRFFCKYCNKTLLITFNEQMQEQFKKDADKWPYPLFYHHAGHWALIYVDTNFNERGAVFSKICFEEQK